MVDGEGSQTFELDPIELDLIELDNEMSPGPARTQGSIAIVALARPRQSVLHA